VEALVMVSEKALDDIEVAARARVDRLQGELDRLAEELSAAREVLSHVEITRATLTAVAAARPSATSSVGVTGAVVPAATDVIVVDRSQRVPVWRAGLTAQALPDYYRPLFTQLVESSEPLRCQQMATALGFDLVPKKIEGVRSKLKRLVERGWAVEAAPGLFAVRA
jgi:Mg-chelatase subunit ChlI